MATPSRTIPTPASADARTTLIHIVGPQGSGKTTLARQMVVDLERQGKKAIRSQDLPCCEDTSNRALQQLRTQPIRMPYQDTGMHFDVVIVEHQQPPPRTAVAHGEQVVTLRRRFI